MHLVILRIVFAAAVIFSTSISEKDLESGSLSSSSSPLTLAVSFSAWLTNGIFRAAWNHTIYGFYCLQGGRWIAKRVGQDKLISNKADRCDQRRQPLKSKMHVVQYIPCQVYTDSASSLEIGNFTRAQRLRVVLASTQNSKNFMTRIWYHGLYWILDKPLNETRIVDHKKVYRIWLKDMWHEAASYLQIW